MMYRIQLALENTNKENELYLKNTSPVRDAVILIQPYDVLGTPTNTAVKYPSFFFSIIIV